MSDDGKVVLTVNVGKKKLVLRPGDKVPIILRDFTLHIGDYEFRPDRFIEAELRVER